MRRVLSIILLVSLVCSFFTGCRGNNDVNPSLEDEVSNSSSEVIFEANSFPEESVTDEKALESSEEDEISDLSSDTIFDVNSLPENNKTDETSTNSTVEESKNDTSIDEDLLPGSGVSSMTILGNSVNCGRVAFHNNRIYFYELNGTAMFSANIDGSDRRKLADVSGSAISIIAVDDWIYYASEYTINRIHVNGEGQSVLFTYIERFPKSLQMYNGWMYFQLNEYIIPGGGDIVEEAYTFWRMKPDGSIAEQICDGGKNMLVYGDWIYYLSYEPDSRMHGKNTLCRVRLDGSGLEKLADNNVEVFTIDNGFLYFSNKRSNIEENGIFSISLDDMSVTKLIDDSCLAINAYNGTIFYTQDDKYSTYKIYKFDIATSKLTNMSVNGRDPNIVQDRLFFIFYDQNLGGMSRIGSVLLDGGDRRDL